MINLKGQLNDFFAFDSKTKEYSPEYLLNMYKEIDPNWNTDPLITSICVAGKGWLTYTIKGWLHMSYDAENKIHEEIIGYLATLVQSLTSVVNSRGYPRIGYYLTDTTKMVRFENGKLAKVSWRGKPPVFTNKRVGDH